MRVSNETFNKMPPELQRLFVKADNPLKDEVLELFSQKNRTSSGSGVSKPYNGLHGGKAFKQKQHKWFDYGDRGSVARFFYCAKVSQKERGKGNNHPTIKPLKLMKYLCRLVTPSGGILIDPFCGSGSTLLAAKMEGFRAVGIENVDEYAAIARNRIDSMGEE